MSATHNIEADFRHAMEEAGITTQADIVADGRLHRFVVDGDKRRSKNGWYTLYSDPTVGVFGCWKRDINEKWCPETPGLSEEERRRQRERQAAAIQAHEEEDRKRQAKAIAKVREALAGMTVASDDHPYLVRKAVPAYGLRLDADGRLVVPVFNVDGELQSVQRIDAGGFKLFEEDCPMKGGRYLIGEIADVVVVTEGHATAASIHQETGLPVVCAFSANNLEPVARSLRERHPETTIIIAADDDRFTDGNPGLTKANAAAAAVGGRLVVPTFGPDSEGTDFNDQAAESGGENVRNAIMSALESEPVPDMQEWEQPLRLDAPAGLPPFPVDVLPRVLHDFVTEVAETTQVPADMPAMAVLGVIAACTAGRYEVALTAHSEPCNLYLLCGMEPGERKSQTMKTVTAPLHEAEASMAEQAKHSVDEARAARDVAEGRAKYLQTKAAKCDDPTERQVLQRELAELLGTMADPVALPQLTVDDATPERLAQLLAENNGTLAMLSAEGGVVGMMAGRYNDRSGPNLDVYLKGHAGDPLRVDRASGRTLHLKHPALTLCLVVQPEVLQELADVKRGRGRGLLGRFLYSLPPSNLGNRPNGKARAIDPTVVHGYAAVVSAMLAQPLGDDPRVLPLRGQARAEWVRFADAVEYRLREEGDLRPLADWASKIAGAVARIAGCLHACEHAHSRPENVPISPETVAAATAIGSYFVSHAQAAYGVMGDSPTMALARRISGWLDRHGRTEFSRSDLYQAIRTDSPDDLKPALRLLEQRSIIREIPVPPRTGAGRTPTSRYIVNPNLQKRSNNANNPTESTRDGHLLNCLNESLEFENEISSDHDDNKSTFPNLAEGANNANNEPPQEGEDAAFIASLPSDPAFADEVPEAFVWRTGSHGDPVTAI